MAYTPKIDEAMRMDILTRLARGELVRDIAAAVGINTNAIYLHKQRNKAFAEAFEAIMERKEAALADLALGKVEHACENNEAWAVRLALSRADARKQRAEEKAERQAAQNGDLNTLMEVIQRGIASQRNDGGPAPADAGRTLDGDS